MSSRKRRNNYQEEMTNSQLRRSARLTEKYGSAHYPLLVSSRPSIGAYSQQHHVIYNEGGKSSRDTDSSFASVSDVHHDHNYSRDCELM
jgi:hypothetical protein